MLDALTRFSKKDRPSRLRAVRTYLLGILACTLLFFLVSVISLVGQQITVRELSVSNLRFGGERIALELEGRMQRLASDCLRRDHLEKVRYSSGDELDPGRLRALRRTFEDLGKAYPIARHFFLVKDGRLVFPRVSPPAPQTLKSLLPSAKSPSARQYEALFAEAEDLEARWREPANAARLYRRAEQLAVSKRLKALAASCAAKALLDAGDTAASVQASQRLLSLYGDQYDLSMTPYALELNQGPDSLVGGIFKSYPLSSVYQDLAKGRWELSAEQAEYQLSRLEQRLGLKAVSRPATDFLDQLALARAVRADFRANPVSAAAEVTARAVRLEGKAYQTYYVSAGSNAEGAIVGFSVSVPWLREELLPESTRKELGDSRVTPLIEEYRENKAGEENAGETYIRFATILPFWRLHIPAATVQASESRAHRELWFQGMSAVMFLCILGLGVYLLISVTQDIQWFQLQSDFVSGVSHELKTPLSLIRLYSETLMNGDQEFPPEERHGYVRIIARESERLSRLIDNVLDFSRLQQGRRQTVLREGDLAAAVKQTVEDYSDYLSLRGFSVKTGIQPYLPPVRFNAEQISQVVVNLMDNARKYSGKSRLIRVHMWRQDDEVVLEVQDYGIGISAAEREKIFEPFYRVPGTGEKGGCGLGLYLVHHVVEDHGGRIEVESELGTGSRFRLFFPVSPSAPEGLKDSGERSILKARA